MSSLTQAKVLTGRDVQDRPQRTLPAAIDQADAILSRVLMRERELRERLRGAMPEQVEMKAVGPQDNSILGMMDRLTGKLHELDQLTDQREDLV